MDTSYHIALMDSSVAIGSGVHWERHDRLRRFLDLRLDHGGEVRPLLDTEGTNVTHRLRKPRLGSQRLYGKKQVHHVFVISDVKTALHAPESMLSKHCTNLGLCLRHTFRVVGLGVGYNQVKSDGLHSVRLRVITQVRLKIFRLLARFDYRDLNHPVTIVQAANSVADFVFRAERPKALDFADRNGGRCLNGVSLEYSLLMGKYSKWFA